MIDNMNPAAVLLPQAVNMAVFSIIAKKSAEDLERQTVLAAAREGGAVAKAAYQNVVNARNAEIRDYDRQLNELSLRLNDLEPQMASLDPSEIDAQLAHTRGQTRWAWYAGAAVVLGAVIWSRR